MCNSLNSFNEELGPFCLLNFTPKGSKVCEHELETKKIIVQFYQISYNAQRRISTLEVCSLIEVGFQSTEAIIKMRIDLPLSYPANDYS